MSEPSRGVVFPVEDEAARRSTSALGRAVVADALRAADLAGARAAARETNWRSGYIPHFRRLLEAGLGSAATARGIAAAGLAALRDRMRVGLPGAEEVPLASATGDTWPPGDPLATVTVTGAGAADRELSVPYQGRWLRGAELARQLDTWVAGGVVEPSCAEAVRRVAANPDWLDLSDLRVVALGAGAEMAPVPALLRWGGEVVAVDLPRPAIWRRLAETAARYGGKLHAPVPGPGASIEEAGVDLLRDLPAVAAWLRGFDGRLVLGTYAYADGGTHVRLAAAADALAVDLLGQRADTALAWLATPTDVYAVPAEAVAHSARAYQRRAALARPLAWLTAGRMLRRNYPPGADPGVIDCLVAQQGPNYALAKRIQRWRATVARQRGGTVSLVVAPMTRTRSVLRNRALAAAYAGAHVFGVEVFEPATSNTLMAALLVHDLRHPVPPRPHPWQDEAAAAAHSGVWRAAYAPRSALGLAAAIGLGTRRT